MHAAKALGSGILLLTLGSVARAEDPMKPHGKPAAPATVNRLAGERSPYLKQHQSNPVDWWPWGPAAFAEAKRLDKPVFLSIGYAACHWCHVMAHESFEDPATAKVMNDVFVNVKVDREERPDVDDVYMAAVQLTTGHGGWPMSVYLLPDGRPFLARTYLRPHDVVATAARVAELWTSDRARLEGAAEEVADAIRAQTAGPKLPPYTGSDADLVKAAVAQSVASFDRERGGFDRRPKFPPHAHLLAFLDRDGAATGPEALGMARVTLDGMALGGVHDHVGGGFHRYSTDAEWLLPHFEKMLYDNALLATAYARAAVVLKEPRYAAVVRGVLGWVERDLAVAGGGYASSLDADTEGEEGLTYTWTPAEVRAALPDAALADLVLDVYGVREGGNYLEEANGKPSGRSILHLRAPLATTAGRLGRPLADLERDLARARASLLTARATRAQPGLDGKVLTSWNGLLLSAFATAGAGLQEPRWLDAGRALARFLLDHARADGRLLRFPKASGPPILGFLDDHVHLADGLLDLAEATGEAAWADEARALADAVLARFADPAGGFFSSSDAHERLLARGKDGFDTPIPSGNATAARVLLRLADRTGLASYRTAADATLGAFRALVARAPSGTMAFVRTFAARAAAEPRGIAPATGDASGRAGPLAVEAFLERGEADPGSAVRVLLRVTLDAGWHVNPAGPAAGDLVPTTLTLAAPASVELRGVVFPPAARAAPGPGAAPVPLLAGTFDVVATLVVPAGTPLGAREVALALGFQPCDATSCRLPSTLRIDLPLRVAAVDGPPRHPTLFR